MTSKDENRNHSKRRTNKQKKPNFKWEAGLPTSSTAEHRITCLYVEWVCVCSLFFGWCIVIVLSSADLIPAFWFLLFNSLFVCFVFLFLGSNTNFHIRLTWDFFYFFVTSFNKSFTGIKDRICCFLRRYKESGKLKEDPTLWP